MNLDRRHLLGGAAAIAALGASAPADANIRRVGGGRAQARAMTTLQRYVEQHRADYGLPGVTVCVVDRDGFSGFIKAGYANLEARTPVRDEHLFQVGSISKVFTALTLWSMAQEGKVSINAKLSELMPEIAVADGRDIALQHLLNHTSGLPANPPLFPEGGLWSGFAPGSHWSYSNVGYQIAGLIAARKDSRLLHEAIEARVLRPLGMNASAGGILTGDRGRYAQGYEPLLYDRATIRPGPMAPSPWVDTDNGAGCVGATASDMTHFLRFLFELAEGRGGPVLSDASAAAFLANPADAPDWDEGVKYGNGLARVTINDRAYLHHTGGMVSFSSSMHVDAEAGVAAFASSNVSHAHNYRPTGITILACELLRAAKTSGPAPTPRPTRTTLEHPERFAGTFTAASGENFEILAHSDRISMRHAGHDSDMQPVAMAAFACTDPRFALPGLIFELEEGAAVRAWAHEVEFVRTPAQGFKPPASAELQALAGWYVSDDRWNTPVAIVARDGGLWFGNYAPMFQLPGGAWRIGRDEHSPERVRFNAEVDGRPTQMLLSGTPYVRRFS